MSEYSRLEDKNRLLSPSNILVAAFLVAIFHEQIGALLSDPFTQNHPHEIPRTPTTSPTTATTHIGSQPPTQDSSASPTPVPDHGTIHTMPEFDDNTQHVLHNETLRDEWGYYYNQRDSRWYYDHLGNSNATMGGSGCLVSDIAMVWSHLTDKPYTPKDVNVHKEWFYPDSAAIKTPLPTLDGHVPIENDHASLADMHNALNDKYCLIVELKWTNSKGVTEYHYVVARGLDAKGHMLINDPWFGDNLNVPFGNHWTNNNLTGRIWEYKK